MAVVVFDADVLIAYLNRDDAHHAAALERMRRALEPANRRVVSAVNYTEVLIGPLQAAGPAGAATVDAMIARLRIETIDVGVPLARRAADVRVRTRLKLPDAYAVAIAADASRKGDDEVRLESFDERVISAYAAL